ncbi:flagellar protein export ATPase FliI [Alkalicaulis satelles]|uniref:Flagellum-specific ATP synthase n=1 Tax=Alkalicaulis satelles TaxID=2609175 RepID=A0A5M6ZSI7_9PROT|nr:flagellar protein export ATPase FliI [Alkalicaulis satelles]KAA5805281.1 flagellar protein export ATPase FliI [Alkalicaulis satelles]
MQSLIERLSSVETRRFRGRVSAVNGLLIEASGPPQALRLGAHAVLDAAPGTEPAACEVVGFRGETALMMAYGDLAGVRPGAGARIVPEGVAIRPSRAWLGRVIDSFARPRDGLGALPDGPADYPLKGRPPCAHARQRLGERLDLGVRALNLFAPMRKGQRLGVFAGSGVGKSVLMGMLARGSGADVIVIGLIGERGREAREFVEDVLGADGRARSVVITETSDAPALARRRAAYVTMATAEYFRDQGLNVLCLMDSVTRFALAQREIGLAAGEPPTTRGYTPSVFAELPALLERAGPGPEGSGSITGLFTVLVDGDDHNEPIADAVRGILDGHIVMSRAIAERGRFPAIDVLKSISRTAPEVYAPEEAPLAIEARKLLAAYADMEELIRLGAYAHGTNPEVDRAIAVNAPLEALLAQTRDEASSIEESFALLAGVLVEQEG